MRSGVSHKKQPSEMSITGGRNPPSDKGGGLLAGGGNQVIRLRVRLLCALAIGYREEVLNAYVLATRTNLDQAR